MTTQKKQHKCFLERACCKQKLNQVINFLQTYEIDFINF